MVRVTRGRGRGGRGRGRGRGPVVESDAGSARGAAQEQMAESQAHPAGSVGGVSGGVGGQAAGAGEGPGDAGRAAGPREGAAADGVHARIDRMEAMFSEFMQQFGGRQPAQGQAPVGQGAAGVQPAVAAVERVPSYQSMWKDMGRTGITFFSGGVKPEEADSWRRRLERNFHALRCPEEYRVDLAVHFLEGDAHLWWLGVASRRAQAVISWADFLVEFNAKYFPQEAVDRLGAQFLSLVQGELTVREYDEIFGRLLVHAGSAFESEEAQVSRFMYGLRPEIKSRCRSSKFATRSGLAETAAAIEEDFRAEQAAMVSPPVQQQRKQQQQQVDSSVGSKSSQGQKRKGESTSGSGQRVRSGQGGSGCFVCGSMDHRAANCPKKAAVSAPSAPRVCYQCGEAGHIKPNCPQLQMTVAVVQPVQGVAADVQPLRQDVMPRIYTSVEKGSTSARPNRF